MMRLIWLNIWVCLITFFYVVCAFGIGWVFDFSEGLAWVCKGYILKYHCIFMVPYSLDGNFGDDVEDYAHCVFRRLCLRSIFGRNGKMIYSKVVLLTSIFEMVWQGTVIYVCWLTVHARKRWWNVSFSSQPKL